MGRYDLEGRYSLKELLTYLESNPEFCYSFISKAKAGLEKITSPGLREIMEKYEADLIYDFNTDVMKIALRQE